MAQVRTIVDCDRVRTLNATEKKILNLSIGVQYVEWDGEVHEVCKNTYQKKDPYTGQPSITVWLAPEPKNA